MSEFHATSHDALVRRAPCRVINLTLAIVAALTAATAVHAQTPVNGFGAMQPSVGHFTVHTMVGYRQFDGDETTQERDIRQVSVATQISYALLSNLAVTLDVPVLFNHLSRSPAATGDSATGIGDMSLLVKWRPWQNDTGPTDTMRIALLGGIQMPGGTESYWDSTGEEWNPLVGVIFSMVRGRHGVNADVIYELNTGGHSRPDGFRYDASYLYRLSPAAYGEESSGAAIYAVAELNGLYETNGNHQLFLAPGLMYEATWWTIDATVMIPLAQDLKDRPETEIAFGVGLRLSF